MAITREQALDCFRSDDLIGIGMEADALRRRLHPEGVVSYLVAQDLDCTAGSSARSDSLHQAVRLGATDLALHASTDTLTLPMLESLLQRLRAEQPALQLHGLTATLVTRLAQRDHLPLGEVLARLKQAGLRSLSGDDAFLLLDPYRVQAGETLCNTETWLALHRAAHRAGLPTSASLTFGLGEPVEARVAHLLALRGLQQETGGFFAFTAVAYSPRHPAPTHRALDEATATDYLTTLAVSRMLLESIANVTATASQGLKVLQMALRFGANDAGAALMDERAARLAGPSNSATEEELRRLIRDAGFLPVQRDGVFGALYLI